MIVEPVANLLSTTIFDTPPSPVGRCRSMQLHSLAWTRGQKSARGFRHDRKVPVETGGSFGRSSSQ